MSTSVNIFRSSCSSSSSGGGGGGQTIVSAVGKAVYEREIGDQWHQIQPLDGDGDVKLFLLFNEQNNDIAVTVDGNEPQEDNTNLLLAVDSNIGDTINGIGFHIEIEGEVFLAVIKVITPEPPR